MAPQYVVIDLWQEISRITEYLELAGTVKGHLAQRLCSEEGHAQLENVAQCTIQHDL